MFISPQHAAVLHYIRCFACWARGWSHVSCLASLDDRTPEGHATFDVHRLFSHPLVACLCLVRTNWKLIRPLDQSAALWRCRWTTSRWVRRRFVDRCWVRGISVGLVWWMAALAMYANGRRDNRKRDLDGSWRAYGAHWSSKRHSMEPRRRISHLSRVCQDLKPAASSEQVLRLDQTTRIHAALPTNKGNDESMLSWHEVGRPQVHGYDLVGVVSLDPLRFISVADEKVARVFGAPRGFVQTMRGLGAVDLNVDEVGCSGQYLRDSSAHGKQLEQEGLPVAATVPPLGLSNKATSDGQDPTFSPDINHEFSHGNFQLPLFPSRTRVGHSRQSLLPLRYGRR